MQAVIGYSGAMASRERSGLNEHQEPTFLSTSVSSSVKWGSELGDHYGPDAESIAAPFGI